MEEKDITILNSQLAVFFVQPLDKPDALFPQLNEALGNVFDQTPLVLPIPKENGLSGVPVVQMRSSGAYSCNLAYARADFFKLGRGVQSFDDIKNDFSKKSFDFVSFFTEKGIAVNRIGFITRFFIRSSNPDEHIARVLNSAFTNLQNGGSARTHEARVTHVARFLDADGIEINHLISLSKTRANIFGAGSDVEGIELMLDFNTALERAGEYAKRISPAFVCAFIRGNSEKIEPQKILNLIYEQRSS
jgi:hypothetical protein